MSNYILYIYHDRKIDKKTKEPVTHFGQSVGHFYVQFQNPQGLTQLFGKVSKHDFAIDYTDFYYDHKGRLEESRAFSSSSKFIKKEVALTKEQFEAAHDFVIRELKNPGFYVASIDDCIDFTQKIYNKAGQPGYFSSLYTNEEFTQASTLATASLKSRYGSYDDPVAIRFPYGVSKDAIAKSLNLDSQLIDETIWSGLEGEVTKLFTIDAKKYKQYTNIESNVQNSQNYFSNLASTVKGWWDSNFNFISSGSEQKNFIVSENGLSQPFWGPSKIEVVSEQQFKPVKELKTNPLDSSYVVEKGDTLWGIAQSCGTVVEAILLLPGNEQYLEKIKLNKEGGVQHVLIHLGDKIALPKKGSKLYAGNFKEKLKELLGQEKEVETKHVEVKKNNEGQEITEIEKGSVIDIDGKEISTQALMEMTVKEQADQTTFLLDNIIRFDEKADSIHKFTNEVLKKLFGEASIALTTRIISERLLRGEKIGKISEDLMRLATAETVVQSVTIPAISTPYNEIFTNKIGRDIVTDFAVNMIANTGNHMDVRDYQMMAYSSANKIVTRHLVNEALESHSIAVRSSAASALAQVTMTIIATKGKLDQTAWMNLGISGIAAYTGSYVATSALTHIGMSGGAGFLGAGLVSGLMSAGIGTVVTMAITSLFKFNRKQISTYIESHSVRVNEEGVLEFITLRPEGTIIQALDSQDKIIQARGKSDVILTGAGNDIVILSGLEGGFVESGANKERQPITIKREKEEVNTYLYFEKIIGSEGSDNKLDGQEGDDYINGRGGNDYIRGGNGHDLIEGGDGNDIIKGDAGDDIIHGGNGDDLIEGNDGNDEIYAGDGDDGIERPISGGKGNDIISGGAGIDIIEGDEGDDVISGDDDNDILDGGKGNDFIYGGNGDDQIYGDSGNDVLEGGEGNDYVYGNDGNDIVKGENGNDVLSGDKGDDLIYGGLGDDIILGGMGNDKLYGGLGNDRYVYKVQELREDVCVDINYLYEGDGDDVIEDIAGENNTLEIVNRDIKPIDLSFSIENNDLKISFINRQGSILIKEFVQASNIESIHLSGYRLNTKTINLLKPNESLDWQNELATSNFQRNDKWEGSTNIPEAYENYYNDEAFSQLSKTVKANIIQMVTEKHYRFEFWFIKSGGYHTTHPHYPPKLEGDNGNNKLIGNYWGEYIYGYGGDDEIYGNNGNDFIYGGSGNDRILNGGNGDDTILGEEGDDGLYGGTGNDKLYGNNGKDDLYGEWGNDQLFGGAGNDHLEGGEGDDILYGEEGQDYLLGGIGNDRLYGGNGNDQAGGGEGDDEIYGEAGDDIIFGNEGNDKLYGGDGNDTVMGNEGNDIIKGDLGDDYLLGGAGDDHIYGGDGDDRILGGHDGGNVNKCKQFSSITEKLGAESFCAEFGSDINERNYLYGEKGNDYIRGNAGPDYIDGGEDDDEIYGGAGSDILYGGDGNDMIFGGEGNDHLYPGKAYFNFFGIQPKNQILVGGAGLDTYYYNEGDGYVEIDDCGVKQESCKYEGDILKFGKGITAENIILTKNYADAIIKFKNDWYGTVLLKEQFGSIHNRIGWLEFSNGLKVAINNMSVGTEYNDKIAASSAINTMFANSGNDEIIVTGKQKVFAGYGSDIIKVSGDNNECFGGFGRDKYILSPDSTNTFLNDISDGNDNIAELLSGISIQDLLPNQDSSGLQFTLRNGATLFTLNKDQQGGLPINRLISAFLNIDLTKLHSFPVLDSSTIVYKGTDLAEWITIAQEGVVTVYGGDGDDIIMGYPLKRNVLAGESGNDILIGNSGNDMLEGGQGDDILYGAEGDDILTGGPGNDRLYAGLGKDFFVYQANQNDNCGNDIIYNFNSAEDAIELTGFGFNDKEYLPQLLGNVTNDMLGNAIITDGKNFHITLNGIDKKEVTAEMFTFGFARAATVQKLYEYYESLPNMIMMGWVGYGLIRLADNPFISIEELALPEYPFLDKEKGKELMDKCKDISYKMFEVKVLSSLPSSFQAAYSRLTKAHDSIKDLSSSEIEPSLVEKFSQAKNDFEFSCEAYKTSSSFAQKICEQYETEFVLQSLAISSGAEL